MNKTKKLKIGFLGANFDGKNMGCYALTYSLIVLLEKIGKSSNTKFNYYLFGSEQCNEQIAICEKKLSLSEGTIVPIIEIMPWRLLTCIKHPRRTSIARLYLNECDIVIDLTSGDSFTDIYGQKRFDYNTNLKLLIEKQGIPLILGPQTYGPFSKENNIKKAKKAIEGAALVISRDQKSTEVLKKIVKKEVATTTDLAFLLPFHKNNPHITSEKIKIGINVSGLLIQQKTELTNLNTTLKANYELYIVKLIKRLINSKIYEIHIIPHVGVDGNEFVNKKFEELFIHNAFNDPIEAKNTIATMDIFIGARMHATIAAFSSGVATIPVAYSRKFSGLYHSIGYNYIVDLNELSTDDAVELTLKYVLNYMKLKNSAAISMSRVHTLEEKNYLLIKKIIEEKI